MEVRATYGAIQAVRDICEPWIELWGGDEWGESMRALHSAAHTSYGLSPEDCATVAEILFRNTILMNEDAQEIGYSKGEDQARQEATEARNYWLKGGNLGSWSTTIEDAKSVIDQCPTWMFILE